MRVPGSIRARLFLGAALVLSIFMAAVGVALQRAHFESLREGHFARLQATVYLLLGAADVDANGALAMPASLPEPRLSVPSSGLYAAIFVPGRGETWRSASTVTAGLPFQRSVNVGEWRFDTLAPAGLPRFLSATYAVRWATRGGDVPLVLSVLEDEAALLREAAAFERTLWSWLGAAAFLLLLSQLLLVDWAVSPLRRVAREIAQVEKGAQSRVEGRYPLEISRLTDNINALVEQERTRQSRYREALSFLAHSLKTPLAVLRTSLSDPANLPEAVGREVRRMDDIVQHQLARAAASGSARFGPPLPLRPVLDRICASLRKVHADKALSFVVDCPPALEWRIDEGDAFELFGNLLDNAAKWAAREVRAMVAEEGSRLHVVIDDDGPGFSDTKSVLQIHVRTDERVPGHGVGLAVVDDLVASHAGSLALSRRPGGGARVEIFLPRG